LLRREIDLALDAGVDRACALLARGLIDGAILQLQGEMRDIGLKTVGLASGSAAPRHLTKSAIYA
jgi:hypothetical protein